MPPLNSDSGFYESTMIIDLGIWNRKTQLGITFSSSSGFKLPDGSIKSPDASWVSKEKWQSLTLRQRKSFAPIAPEFIVEVRSKTDSLVVLQTKMEEWIENGVLLAWLIDPTQQKAYIYRADGSTTQIDDFDQILSGENVLPEFIFDLNALQMP
jgi:Uma2 family endonuclease